MLDGKSILVTGGTGSFGKEFVRTVLEKYDVRRLIVFSRDELKQYEMQQKFSRERYPCMRYFIGDVRDRIRLEMAFRGVDYVIHAAALKHVPVAEYNPFECINTNVNGAENIVQAALRAGVKSVVALSTDKAVNPINLYGASKLAADKIFTAANHLSAPGGTRFSVVRYGNVVGSRGSVIPFFRKLVAEGAKTIPITDSRMTRFWITLEQGIGLVMDAISMMRGGEIFVPKIPSMKVVDLANCIAPGIPQEIVGIRPGEKLHEAMITEDDSRTTYDMGDRYVVMPSFHDWGGEKIDLSRATLVPPGFRYASDTNSEWLDADQLARMMAGTTEGYS